MPGRVHRVEQVFDHGPGHDRESRHEMHRATARAVTAEAGDLVVRVGNDARACREHPHVEAVHVVRSLRVVGFAAFSGQVAHALLDQVTRLGVQRQFHPECGGGALAGVIVGRGADAATREHHVSTVKGLAQRTRDAVALVAHALRPGQRQPTRLQQFDDLGQVFVGPFAGEDFVADDDQTEGRLHGTARQSELGGAERSDTRRQQGRGGRLPGGQHVVHHFRHHGPGGGRCGGFGCPQALQGRQTVVRKPE